MFLTNLKTNLFNTAQLINSLLKNDKIIKNTHNIMTNLIRFILLTIFFTVFSSAAPVGIFLHAYSPEAPAEKIECFEYERLQKDSSGTWAYLANGRAVLITNYRNRGTIPYVAGLTAGHPDFDKYLKYYEERATSIPSTRVFLNPRILSMRALADANKKAQAANELLSKTILGGKSYTLPSYKGIDKGKLTLSHKDGVAKIDIDTILDNEWLDFVKLDPQAGVNKLVLLAGKRVWNPKYIGIKNNLVHIGNEKDDLLLPIDSLSEADKKIISSWSDGSWKIAKPGFYGFKDSDNSYAEIVLENGKFYTSVNFLELEKENVILKTSRGQIRLPIAEIVILSGISSKDQQSIKTWVEKIIDARMAQAKPETTSEVISLVPLPEDDLLVTDVTVKILQVLDEGVLASAFVGLLHKGTKNIRLTTQCRAIHPLTGKMITKIIEVKTVKEPDVERVTDDLCYIVGNTDDLVDGQLVKAKSMRLKGRFQYTDIRGASRSVRKYHVD